ncbi:MAG: DNA recombination protein RmuC [Pseudomonadota bacterium]
MLPNQITEETLLYLIIGILIGALFVWLLLRKKLTTTDAQRSAVQQQLAVETERVQQKDVRLDEISRELERSVAKSQSLQSELEQYKVNLAELNTTLQEERKQAEEKLTLLQQAEKKMTDAFENLSNKILEEKSKKFTDQNKSHLGEILNPLREQLGDFKKKVEDVYEKETKERLSLFHEITHLKSLNEKMSQDAINLTNALKGESKTRGDWGEVILEKVLEHSGLRKDREYQIQPAYKDEENRHFRPDVVVHLPDNRDVIIDSKVSLVAYERYYAADDEQEKKHALSEHIKSIKTHISSLSKKNYEELTGMNSLDMVLMFVPIEPALMLALEEDDTLFQDAFKQGLFLVSPSTLSMNLQIIHNIWRNEYQNQNAKEIAKSAGNLYDKFVGFVESLEDVGDKLDKAKESYATAFNRLTDGHGNLVARVDKIRELGSLKTKKSLSAELLQKALPDSKNNTNE